MRRPASGKRRQRPSDQRPIDSATPVHEKRRGPADDAVRCGGARRGRRFQRAAPRDDEQAAVEDDEALAPERR